MRAEPRYKRKHRIGGRYLVHKPLMGGMGEVYLCLDLKTRQPFALKTFQPRYLTNLKLREAFETEVKTWVELGKHPNIVRCFLMDVIENLPFMFLEWIDSDEIAGTDLRSWLQRGPLDLRRALDFGIDICRGLIHAGHQKPGIVHRDLKPDNVLIEQGRIAKITDFGLAKIVQEAGLEITEERSGAGGRQHLSRVGGTPAYMAPEQWKGEKLDERTDIYGVGCILYEMLTGKMAFEAKGLEELGRLHLGGAIPTLAENKPPAAALNKVLKRCMAKGREDRFESVEVLVGELSLVYERQFSERPRAIAIDEAGCTTLLRSWQLLSRARAR